MMQTFLLCILVLTLSAAEARHHNLLPNSTLRSPKRQAEDFIKRLNLFPQHDINIVEDDPAVTAPTIVETSFRFPSFNESATANAAGATVKDLGHHAGYFRLPHTKGARMFYFFFESRNKNASAPVVIWLSGGPGCSGSLALFYENGPFHITNDLSLKWNDFGWDTASNLIYVDQPTGTGFSYSTNNDDIRSTSQEAAGDFYDFLQAFFEKHPEYVKNDFYITGESYAGHYIPAFADQIHQRNKNKQGIQINLKGIAIGNGLTDPAIQYQAYLDYALDRKLIDKSQYNELNQSVPTCEEQISACGANSSSACNLAYGTCIGIFNQIVDYNNGINYYDIRKKCEGFLCYDFSNVERFLSQDSVKQALGVGGDVVFVSCSSQVYDAMSGEEMKDFEVYVPGLLQDGIKLLVYAGEYDLICNWLGNSRWVESVKWSGQKQFQSAANAPFMVENVAAGLQKSFGPVTFLKVYNAGHLVPMDQPKASLEMLSRWIQNKPL